MTQSKKVTALYLLASGGFIGQGVAAVMGAAPPWPNRNVWAIVAFAVAVTLIAYVIIHKRPSLRLAVSAILLASVGRTIGWLASPTTPTESRIAATSVWVIVGSLGWLVYIKAGHAREES